MTDAGYGSNKRGSESKTFEAVAGFARAIAHDLNNFLSAISGSAELLKRQLGTDDPLVDEIKEASGQASFLTQQVIRLTEEPREGPETGIGPEGSHVQGSRSHAKTILVVLSQQSVRILVSEFLSAYGYRVLQASGPETAAAIGESHEGNIDAILVELDLPSCPGPDLVSRLKERHGAVPTIYVADLEARPEITDGDMLLRRPLRPGELSQTLERLLERGTLD